MGIGYLPASASDYQRAQGAMLPRGRIWRWEGTRLGLLLRATGAEWARVHERMLALLSEADPRHTVELLDGWLTALGLPGCGAALPSDTDEQRALAHAAHIASGGVTPAYFVTVAAAMGVAITITEGLGPFRAGMRVGGRLYGKGWVHVWQVVAPTEVSGTDVADILECIFRRQKPLHTRVHFLYTA